MTMPSAVLMAGGRGARLMPYTKSTPKPLMPLDGETILARLLRQMRSNGIHDVTISVGHHAEQIESTIGDGKAFDLNIKYVHEREPLGTCGILASLIGTLGDTFILANGDLLTDFNLAHLVEAHHASGAAVTMGVFELETSVPYGVLAVDADQRVRTYIEKPKHSYDVSMGIYAIQRDAVWAYFDEPERYRDMPDLINWLITRGQHVCACRGASFWIDVGTPSDYVRAAEHLAATPKRHVPDGGECD